jgi:hypothetical protein
MADQSKRPGIISRFDVIPSATLMRDVSFSDCHFYRLTILVTALDARGLKQFIPLGAQEMPVITDGTYGEI